MLLPKLKIKEGRYLGTDSRGDVYDAPYYSVEEVKRYKKAARDLLKEYNKMKYSLERINTFVKNCEENITVRDIVHEEICKYD